MAAVFGGHGGILLINLAALVNELLLILESVVAYERGNVLKWSSISRGREKLRLILVEKVGSRRDIPISIIADADTRHAMVVMSMDTVSQLGFKQLSISTQKPLSGD